MPKSNNQDHEKKSEFIHYAIAKWYTACMITIEKDLLSKPRPYTGAVLFFLGSIDNLCQSMEIAEEDFIITAISILDNLGFEQKITIPVIRNFYSEKTKKSDFAMNANLEGGRKIAEFLSGKNNAAPIIFAELVEEWNKNPDFSDLDLNEYDI